LIETKSGSTEKHATDRNIVFDRFLETALAVKAQRPVLPVSPELAEEADRLFRQTLTWSKADDSLHTCKSYIPVHKVRTT